jgi:hypothetical protein
MLMRIMDCCIDTSGVSGGLLLKDLLKNRLLLCRLRKNLKKDEVEVKDLDGLRLCRVYWDIAKKETGLVLLLHKTLTEVQGIRLVENGEKFWEGSEEEYERHLKEAEQV